MAGALDLREAEAADLPRLATLRADRGLQHLLMANPDPTPAADPLAEAAAWLQRRQSAGYFRVIADEAGDAAGFTQITDIHRKNRFGWLGICLSPAARGRGLGRAALAALEAEARDGLGLRKLLLQVRADNVPAIALYDSAGWRRAGVFTAQYDDGEALHDVLLFEKALDQSAGRPA